MTTPLALLVGAYVLGATPTSWVVGRVFFGVDLREHGSGNLGATNAVRVLGWRAGVPAGLFDVFKGWLPPFLFPGLAGVEGAAWTLGYAGAAILGHVFSFWLRFRGGKGVATSAGAFLALAPVAFTVGAVVWAALAFTVRIVSLASMSAALVLPAAVWFTVEEARAPLTAFTAALAIFVIWAHRSNIRRLLRGEEPRFSPRSETPTGEGPPGQQGGAE